MSKEEQKTYGKGKYTEKDFKNPTEEMEDNLDFLLARTDWWEDTGVPSVSLNTDKEIDDFVDKHLKLMDI